MLAENAFASSSRRSSVLTSSTSRCCRAGITWSGLGHVEEDKVERSLRSTSDAEVCLSRQLTGVSDFPTDGDFSCRGAVHDDVHVG